MGVELRPKFEVILLNQTMGTLCYSGSLEIGILCLKNTNAENDNRQNNRIQS